MATTLKSESLEATAVKTDPWVRVLNGKRGLHLQNALSGRGTVAHSMELLYLAVGLGTPSPAQLACKLLARVPKHLTRRFTVVVLADTEFGTVEFLQANPLTAVASSSRNALQPSDGEWQDAQTTLSHW